MADPDTLNDDTAAVLEEDDQTGFDEGFEADTPPTETPGAAADEDLEPEPSATPPPPKYTQVTEEQLASLLAAASEVASLRDTQQKSFGTAFGKIGGIERALSEKANVDIRQEDIDALRGDGFEPLAVALEKLRDVRLVRQEIAPEALTDIKVNLKRELQVEEVAEVHPDWNEVRQTPEFTAWLATQSAADQQRLASTWSPRHVIKALDMFKASGKRALPPKPPADDSATRTARMNAARTPRGTGAHAGAPATDDDFDGGFAGRPPPH